MGTTYIVTCDACGAELDRKQLYETADASRILFVELHFDGHQRIGKADVCRDSAKCRKAAVDIILKKMAQPRNGSR